MRTVINTLRGLSREAPGGRYEPEEFASVWSWM